VEFAQSMATLQVPSAEAIAGILNADAAEKLKVLDIAAGHGMFGIALAKHNLNAEIYALDWPRVLEVAEQNAAKAGVLSRYHKLPGSAFELDYGKDYDIVLLTNILHHFDPVMNEMMLRRVRAALAPGGRAVTLEFVPNDDRVTPPRAAAFSLTMLASTPEGDAYTFREFNEMFRAAGFSSSEKMELPSGFQTVIISRR
jgi:2-polyprenyl-3-methyl-5-hydroxy-6-metoxy-1,4-benzoquinol methylase